MDPLTAARREIALEIQSLADEFQTSDEAALRRSRIICWISTGLVTALVLILLVMGADSRYLGFFWVVVVGLVWASHLLSSRRQHLQTARLRTLATRWLDGVVSPAERSRLP